jgi:hypothetical protein
VYTTVFGSYDELLEPIAFAEDDSDYLCFTDDPELVSLGWDIRLVEPAFPQDPVRSARLVKILGHEVLSRYDVTLYVDASVRLSSSPAMVIDSWLGDGDEMALPVHSYREQVLDEFDEVIRLNYDDRARIFEQLVDYSVQYPAVLDARPYWTGMMVRRSTPAVDAAMRVWADHVLRYSRRDQLSVVLALQTGDLSVRGVMIDNFNSPFHEWPVIRRRRIPMGKAPTAPIGPLVADLRRAHAEIARQQLQIEELGPERLADLRRTIEDQKQQIQQGVAERTNLEQRIDAAKRQVGAAEAQLHAVTGVAGAIMNLCRAVVSRIRGHNSESTRGTSHDRSISSGTLDSSA